MKPPYELPTMEDVRSIAPNGFSVVSTFSGSGGSCLGYRLAGFNVLWASEFIESAREVYQANHDSPVDGRDIRDVTPEEILEEIGLAAGELDILDGSPPCASFSDAGSRDRSWNKVKQYSETKQRVDDLFFEYIRILRGIRPKVFIAENVSGLIKGRAKGFFLEILREMKDSGYRVEAKLLDARWLGVPQMRKRLIFVGVRLDLERDPAFPSPLPYYYTTQDACPNIRYVKHSNRPFNWKTADRAHPTLTQTRTSPTAYLSGGEWVAEQDIRGYRRLTIQELKRLFSFPDDFIVSGSDAQQWERIARTVPPRMMEAVATAVKEKILDVKR